MDPTTLAALAAAFLGSGLLTAVANNIWNRRRAGADTAAVLNKAALELFAPYKEEVKELRGEMKVLRQQNGVMARQVREYQSAQALHQAWDISVQAAIMAHGIEVPAMPALAPVFHVRERTRAEDYDLPDTREDRDDE